MRYKPRIWLLLWTLPTLLVAALTDAQATPDPYSAATIVDPILADKNVTETYSLSILGPSSRSSHQCENIHFSRDKCGFARKHCADQQPGYINYIAEYYCASNSIKAAALLAACIFLLSCLFMVVGIAACDFLCPNLNTISRLFGMSETLTGVTFLAFGNGSPDICSTFVAMSSGSGSLAVGELLGAAVFITAAVTGSMAIVRPFRVSRTTFVRDIGFFIVSMSFALWFISDGELRLWESFVMFGLYIAYVIIVVGWHYYSAYRYRQSALARLAKSPIINETQPLHDYLSVHDYSSTGVVARSSLQDPPRLSISTPVLHSLFDEWSENYEDLDDYDREVYGEVVKLMRESRTHNIHPHDRRLDTLPNKNLLSPAGPSAARPDSPSYPSIRPSLISAVEFRDALRRLKKPKNTDCESPPLLDLQQPTPIHGATFLSPDCPRSPLGRVANTIEGNRGDEPCVTRMSLDVPDRVSPRCGFALNMAMASSSQDSLNVPIDSLPISPTRSLTNLDELEEALAEDVQVYPKTSLKAVLATLFPGMDGLLEKSWYGMLTSVITAPFVFLLTISVPVYESEFISKPAPGLSLTPLSLASPMISPGGLDHAGDNGYDFPLNTASEIHEESLKIPRWLLKLQFASAPLFIYFFKFANGSNLNKLFMTPIPLAVSAFLLLCLHYYIPSDIPGSIANQRLSIVSFAGFVMAITWVSIVSQEVVILLKAFGIIFQLSDAILGLTIFAVGNSLGDLFADVTFARMGLPRMAFSACFGGPLLNILAGIGVSGIHVLLGTSKHDQQLAYHIDISPTLVVSGITLLTTSVFLLIAIPLNQWKMTRTIGIISIGIWILSTALSVAIEFNN